MDMLVGPPCCSPRRDFDLQFGDTEQQGEPDIPHGLPRRGHRQPDKPHSAQEAGRCGCAPSIGRPLNPRPRVRGTRLGAFRGTQPGRDRTCSAAALPDLPRIVRGARRCRAAVRADESRRSASYVPSRAVAELRVASQPATSPSCRSSPASSRRPQRSTIRSPSTLKMLIPARVMVFRSRGRPSAARRCACRWR